MTYYIFNTNSSEHENKTVIVDFQLQLHFEDIRSEFVHFHKTYPRLNSVIYLGPKVHDHTDQYIINELADILNKNSEDISVLLYDENGLINDTSLDYDWILKEGILNIISKRKAVIFSDSNFHFELPSGRHSPYLIRTANILSNSQEINFLSLCLLEIIKDQTYKRIACDSSSIMHVAYGLKYLKSLFGKIWESPIESFYSYKYKQNNYVFKPNTLVLISASNSGNLEKDILSNGENDLDVVTILLNSPDTLDLNFIINLNDYRTTIFSELPKVAQFSQEKCSYCDNHSILVKVHGEQFLPSKTLRVQRVLSTHNKPKWLNRVVDSLKVGEGVVCFRGETKGKKKYREIFIDIANLFDYSNSFKQQFKTYVSNFLPSKVDLIIYNSDQSSKLVAEQLKEHYDSISKATVIPLLNFDSLPTDRIEDSLNIIIVCSCITTGNQFNSISRELRDFEKSSLHYFTVFSKLTNNHQFEILKKNLEFRSVNKSTCVNKLHTIFEGYLPDINSLKRNKYAKPNWENELEFWEETENPPVFIQERIKILRTSNGLIDNLFLVNPFNFQKLKLRPNFAFYEFKNLQPTQAMVYYIMSSILHNSRALNSSLSKEAEVLINHEHSHSIISLECFRRFNDGVIQASLLRASLPIELDYSCSEEISLEALKTFKDLFKNPNSTQDNEGILEFLYALVTRKMKLKPADTRILVKYLEEKYHSNNMIMYMLSLII